MKINRWKMLGQVPAALAVALPVCASLAQEFGVQSVGIRSVAGASTDGNFAVSGVFAPAAPVRVNDDYYAIDGGLRGIGPARASAAPELVANGGFEDTLNTFLPDGLGLMSLRDGSETIPGWKVTTGEMAWIGNGNFYGAATPFGDLFLDLTGCHDAPPYGGVTQTLATVAGGRYRLSFALGADQDVGAYHGPMTIQVTAGAHTESFTFMPASMGNQWETFTMSFTATSATTPLAFAGGANFGGAYLGFDNVSVVADSGANEVRFIGVISAAGELTLTFPTVTGAQYFLEYSDDLTSSRWQTLTGSPRVGTGEEMSVTTPFNPQAASRFFRLRRSP